MYSFILKYHFQIVNNYLKPEVYIIFSKVVNLHKDLLNFSSTSKKNSYTNKN